MSSLLNNFSLKIYFQNARSLKNKLNDLYISALAQDYDILCFNETWLNESVNDSEILDNRYNIVRRDRCLNQSGLLRGGGVLIALDKKFSFEMCDNTINNMEYLILKVSVSQLTTFYLCVVYFRPNTSADDYMNFYSIFSNDVDMMSKPVLILGDFNLSNINWSEESEFQSLNEKNLFNFLCLCNMKQFNHCLNYQGRILDLVISNLTSEVLFVTRADKEEILVREDVYHPSLILCYKSLGKIKSRMVSSGAENYNFRKGYFQLFYELMRDSDWNYLNAIDDINEAVSSFYAGIYNILDVCFPKFSPKRKKFPIWFNSDIIYHIKLKNRLRKKMYDNVILINAYKALRRIVKVKIKDAYKNYINITNDNLVNNASNFWAFVRNSKNNYNECNTMIYKTQKLTNNIDIAQAFAQHFSSVYLQSSDFDFNVNTNKCDNFCQDFSAISVSEIMAEIKLLKGNKSAGLDKIPPYLIKGCAGFFVYPLLILFNKSLKANIFPDAFKKSKITPIFKKGNRADIENYRPITILSVFSKIFEGVIQKRIYSSIGQSITNVQHGFLKGRSTVTNLLTLNSEIVLALHENRQIDVIYTDFSKAFDSVDFGILMRKLLNFGLSDGLVKWIYSYLINRHLVVSFQNCFSTVFTSPSGVPQGSTLGPLLFILFINDLPECLKFSECLLFADDAKIYKHIYNFDDCITLQDDLLSLNRWCLANRLFLNYNKCSVISFSHKHSILMYNYCIDHVFFSRCSSILDLGVKYDSKYLFSEHISNIVSVCFKNLGFILRACRELNSASKISIFNYLVRSKLEYACIVWDPHYDIHIKMIEKIQNIFLRHLFFTENGYCNTYTSTQSLRESFKIQDLQSRRKLLLMLFFHKLLNNNIDSLNLIRNIFIIVPRPSARNKSLKFFGTHIRTSTDKNFYINKFCSFYNLNRDYLDIFSMSFSVFRKTCMSLIF